VVYQTGLLQEETGWVKSPVIADRNGLGWQSFEGTTSSE
jgi:hypothetical protein